MISGPEQKHALHRDAGVDNPFRPRGFQASSCARQSAFALFGQNTNMMRMNDSIRILGTFVTLSQAYLRQCSQNTQSRSRSLIACQSVLIECSGISNPCESRWKAWKRSEPGGVGAPPIFDGPNSCTLHACCPDVGPKWSRSRLRGDLPEARFWIVSGWPTTRE
jgi:hypothetical protein